MMEKEISKMEKYSSYHIQTDGFQHVLVGMAHMARAVLPDRKCRVVIDYDPALPKVSIETFTDKSDGAKVDGKTKNGREVGKMGKKKRKKKKTTSVGKQSISYEPLIIRRCPVGQSNNVFDEHIQIAKATFKSLTSDKDSILKKDGF